MQFGESGQAASGLLTPVTLGMSEDWEPQPSNVKNPDIANIQTICLFTEG